MAPTWNRLGWNAENLAREARIQDPEALHGPTLHGATYDFQRNEYIDGPWTSRLDRAYLKGGEVAARRRRTGTADAGACGPAGAAAAHQRSLWPVRRHAKRPGLKS